MDSVNVAVLGASGYTGGELLRLLAGHPCMNLIAVTAEKHVGSAISAVFPSLASTLPPLSFEPLDPEAIAQRADAVFLALPHTKSLEPVAACQKAGKPVVDLSADYRLKNPAVYETWYQTPHPHPRLLEPAVYGLPELRRSDIRAARLVASPGCYPTAAILQLAPLAAHGLIVPDSIVIDAKSGVSGAGRSPALPYHFPEAHESIEAYKIGRHRHIPEIEQELNAVWARNAHQGSTDVAPGREGLKILFTPHLVPMNRGILSTAYCRLGEPVDISELRALYATFYKGERFIRLKDGDSSPNPSQVRGSNFCDLGIFTDTRAGWVVTVAALDNLVKGAAGQAIQAMNLMLGFPEELGLTAPGVFP
ncbi:MAG TPA: N-acetyl-gamma-glutamyl-phosphate reductase [Nitrospiraceae bacterium]|nr:N-acetyl-gamma-glutamyl-phosphate reductase [Nitrospiraceae bacterium]